MRPVLPQGRIAYQRKRAGARTTQPAERRLAKPRTWIIGAAAACLAVITVPSLMVHVQADYLTGRAETKDVELADGSLARLAPHSAIAVTYATNHRQVRLLKGETWFDVRRDAARPFYIDANGVTTELARGRVRVDYTHAAPPVSEQLLPGQAVHVGFDGTVSRDSRPVEQVAAWRNRQIIVHDRPASEVIDALRPWYSGVIIVRSDGFDGQRVTGLYNAANLVEALKGLTQAYGGSVSTVTPWLILLSSR